jgi:hypothetical protein
VAAELCAGHHVVYIHYEEGDPASTVERLRFLGVGDDLMSVRLRFVAPARPARDEWIAPLLDPPPTLVVHDGVNEAMSLHSADIMAADGAARFRRRLVVPFLRVGAATIACDHVPKDREARGRDAYGSVHKGNALDGARILLEMAAAFGRGLRGASHVFVTKDRPGQLRVHGRPTSVPGKTYIGTLVADDADPFTPFALSFYAPRDDDPDDADPAGEPAQLADTVWQVVAALPEGKVTSLRMLYAEMRKAGHQFGESKVHDAVDDLIAADRLHEVSGKRGAQGFQATTTAAEPGCG